MIVRNKFSLVMVGLVMALLVLTCRDEVAYAIPTLQSDIGGGTYNSSPNPVGNCSGETTCAANQQFTLYALYTPGGNAPSPNDTYFISAALEPATTTANPNLGSFLFGGNAINVTTDMTAGTPNGLPPHGAFPTFFKEFSFTFAGASNATPYDVSQVVGTHTGPSGSGTMLYVSFSVDTTNLDTTKQLHFDLYHFCPATGGTGFCRNHPNAVDQFAPFSHDAESLLGGGGPGAPVPEPSTWLLLITGCALLLGYGWYRRSSESASIQV
jgi:PEP-CTERM motif